LPGTACPELASGQAISYRFALTFISRRHPFSIGEGSVIYESSVVVLFLSPKREMNQKEKSQPGSVIYELSVVAQG
jgi:hypothetical protein